MSNSPLQWGKHSQNVYVLGNIVIHQPSASELLSTICVLWGGKGEEGMYHYNEVIMQPGQQLLHCFSVPLPDQEHAGTHTHTLLYKGTTVSQVLSLYMTS